jgi:viroplasmin and RNaseH domain-containing protein
MFDSFNEANDYARNNQGVLTEYEFEYSDSYVVTDYTGQQQDDEVEGMIGLVGEDAS